MYTRMCIMSIIRVTRFRYFTIEISSQSLGLTVALKQLAQAETIIRKMKDLQIQSTVWKIRDEQPFFTTGQLQI